MSTKAYRAGIPWRDLPREEFGPWRTVWKRHRRYAGDGTWDRVLARILAEAEAAGKIDWCVSVDATIARAHQHAILADIHVPRLGPGRARTLPDRVIADRAYATGAIRDPQFGVASRQ